MDALLAYEEALKIDPGFSMALGNKAIAMVRFADICGIYRGAIYNSAYRILNEVKDDDDLIRHGGIGAKKRIEREVRLTLNQG